VEAFRKTAVKEDPRFITESCFGQHLTAVQSMNAEFTGLAGHDRNFNYTVYPDDKSYSWLYEELMREINSPENPLLIRTLNNAQKIGCKRDCWIVNPRMTDAKLLKAFQFLGSLIAQRFEKGPDDNPLNIAYAPTFWKMLLDEEMSLEDFAWENNKLNSRLAQLDAGIREGRETWSYTDSVGVTKRIPGSEEGQLVTEENVSAFKEALLKAHVEEVKLQMDAVRKGFNHIMNSKGSQQVGFMTRMINWHDLMVMIEGKTHKNYDFGAIRRELDYQEGDEATRRAVARVFDYLETLNYETKKAFLSWACGVSR